MSEQRDANPNRDRTIRPQAVVYGAGVTGLTVAHELATRGFMVIVIEPAEDKTTPKRQCAVGGMARTQWGSISAPFEVGRGAGTMIPTQPIVPIRQRIHFQRGQTSVPWEEASTGALSEVARTLKDNPKISLVYVEGFAYDEGEGRDALATSETRAQLIVDHLVKLGVSPERLFPVGLGHAFTDDRAMRPDERRYVGFRVRNFRLPGEHGYRFFPSFYRHLFDTMERTPILERRRVSDYEFRHSYHSVAKYQQRAREAGTIVEGTLDEESIGYSYVETHFNARNNVIPLPQHSLAREGDDKPPVVLERRRGGSFDEMRTLVEALLGDLGFHAADIALFVLKLFKFQTSCEARREKEYSDISWMDFIEGHRYSEAFRCAMEKWPYSLVALSATECDARTHGIITTQLLLDQLKLDFTDGTLNGPTSPAWLDHWRTYLEKAQGVKFRLGALTGFEWDEKGLKVEHRFVRPDGSEATGPIDGYCVICLPVEKVKALFPEALVKAIDEEIRSWPREARRNDVRLAVEYDLTGCEAAGRHDAMSSLGERDFWNVPRPQGPLRHFSGVQFYFEQDVNWVKGHTYYPDSAWGLSSIAQTSFRLRPANWREGYHGVVSVDIGIMDQPGSSGRAAWHCDRHEIAAEVWNQIRRGAESGGFRVPDPVYYHVDDNLVFYDAASGRIGIEENRSPFLIPKAGMWESRPGKPGEYHVYLDRLVLAGTYMKTHTRLTTMEAANESARHAVNAILKHYSRKDPDARVGTPCDIWPIEDNELRDLKFLKELDRKLFGDGTPETTLPHFVDILDMESLPASVIANLWKPDGGAQPDSTMGLFEKIRAAAAGVTPLDLVEWLRRALGRATRMA